MTGMVRTLERDNGLCNRNLASSPSLIIGFSGDFLFPELRSGDGLICKSPRMCGDVAAVMIDVPTGEKRWSDGGAVVPGNGGAWCWRIDAMVTVLLWFMKMKGRGHLAVQRETITASINSLNGQTVLALSPGS
ncbi:hypothetical protein U1Q18_021620 [Sarracenia purpurea var. burkii]